MYSTSRQICEPFVLTKENIRKIVDIYSNRIPLIINPKVVKSEKEEIGTSDLYYVLTRLDKSQNITRSMEDIFSEENRGNNRIVGLTIRNEEYSKKNVINFIVEFNSCENERESYENLNNFRSIKIIIDGNNRDTAQLLYLDIDTYIQNSVISTPNKKWIRLIKVIQSYRTSMIMSLLMGLLFIGMAFPSLIQGLLPDYSNDLRKNQLIQETIESTDTDEKLNKLLELHMVIVPAKNDKSFIDTFSTPIVFTLIIVGLIRLLMSLLWMNERIKKKFCSLLPFIFHFGTNPEDYQYRIRTVKVIISSIGVVFLGLISNLVYNLIIRL